MRLITEPHSTQAILPAAPRIAILMGRGRMPIMDGLPQDK
jgi:hypothetical protein